MKTLFRNVAAIGLLAAVALPVEALASDYPTQPVRIVLPFAAGGSTDIAIRTFAQHAETYLGQSIAVENRTGGGGGVGVNYGVNVEPDGYTLMGGAIGAHSILPAVNRGVGYEPSDYTPIGMFQMNPVVLLVLNESDHQSLDDVIAAIGESSGSLSHGDLGPGTIHRLTFLLFLESAGLAADDVIYVPFGGGADSLAALLGGHVDFHATNLTNAAESLRAGAVRALAVTTPERVDHFPDIPTFAELGHPDVDTLAWRGIIGPNDLPSEVVETWDSVIRAVIDDAEWAATVEERGDIVFHMGPDAFAAFIDSEFERYRRLAEELDFIVE